MRFFSTHPRSPAIGFSLVRCSLRNSWGTHGELMGNSWGTHGELMGNSWGTLGELMGNSWGTHGELLGNLSGIHGFHFVSGILSSAFIRRASTKSKSESRFK